MKAIIHTAVAVTFALGAMTANCITLSVDKVQQRYPWNGIVDIDYTVAYADGEAPLDAAVNRLEFTFIDESVSPAASHAVLTIDKAPTPMTAGRHRIAWNANADGVTAVSSQCRFTVKAVQYAERYLVIDLDQIVNNKYVVSYYDGQPVGGFNQAEYKKSKMVFRLVPAGSYTMGSPKDETGRTKANEKQHPVTISKPFWVSIFETTRAQQARVSGSTDSTALNDMLPKTMGRVDITGRFFASVLNGKLPSNVQLSCPTEGQWEYACRAGTADAFGGAELSAVGRYKDNGNALAEVGSYAPNAWGLYDMHGNAREWCRDAFVADPATGTNQVDPIGPEETGSAVVRGGYYGLNANECRSASRAQQHPGLGVDYTTCRFVINTP